MTLPLRSQRARAAILATLLAAALSPACGRPEELPRGPNVLLISIDTLRADHLSSYGYERRTSPRIDRLAEEGVLFERCTSSTSWTLPAHVSMLTGLPVSAHGICDDRLWTRSGPDGTPLTVEMRGVFLPEVLRGGGYRTGGFYTWMYLEPKFGFGPGFEVYERLGHNFYSYRPVARRFEELRAANDIEGLKALAAEYPELFDSSRPSSPETIDRALEWIDGVRGETPESPFFCFVHLFDVHDPYTPPAPFDERFTDPAYDGSIDGRNVTAPDSAVRADMPARDLAQLVALYDGEIAWVDSEIGRLLDALAARGLDEQTLVVLTSDHGEEFFEHGHKTHRHSLYQESVHVPLILRWPGGLPAGRRVAGPVGLVDVAPTIGELCGLAAPPGATGRDLSAVARGESPNGPRTYLSELYLFDRGPAPLRRLGLLEGDQHALLETVGREPWQVERFDLAHDPREAGAGQRFPLAGRPGASLRARLATVRSTLAAARSRAPLRPAGEAGLDATERAELESMGYTGGDDPGPRSADATATERPCIDGCVWPDGE